MPLPAAKPRIQADASLAVERCMTRTEVCDLLNVSVATVLGHERHGRLPVCWAVRADASGALRNMALYRLEDVLKLPRKGLGLASHDPDELCARAFELFDQGKSPKHAVIELRASFQKIAEIHEQWRDSGGVAMEIGEPIKRELVALVGEFESGTELVDLVKRKCMP